MYSVLDIREYKIVQAVSFLEIVLRYGKCDKLGAKDQ